MLPVKQNINTMPGILLILFMYLSTAQEARPLNVYLGHQGDSSDNHYQSHFNIFQS